MLNSKTIGQIATAGTLSLAFLVLTAEQADARPAFLGVFKKTYPELAKSKEVKVKCAVCHSSKDADGETNKKKKARNNYGVRLKMELGKKNEKDKEKIAMAIKKIEGEKSLVKDKTFGDLINEGKLPGEDKPVKEES
ncbi:MAG: hypothetical protein ABGZ35_14180 [Planctomycetaceae bacterium]